MNDNIVHQILTCLGGFSRSKFGEYKEYHTNADNLRIISNKSLNNSLDILIKIVNAFELDLYPKTKIKVNHN